MLAARMTTSAIHLFDPERRVVRSEVCNRSIGGQASGKQGFQRSLSYESRARVEIIEVGNRPRSACIRAC